MRTYTANKVNKTYITDTQLAQIMVAGPFTEERVNMKVGTYEANCGS